jgi:predicted nuclease with TOPRIM domain
MSEDLTRKMPGSFEERVIAEFAAMRQEFAEQREMIRQLHSRANSIDERLISLEDKVDARLRETRPIWEGVQQRLTEIGKGLDKLNRQFKLYVQDAFELRARVEKLEDEQSAREG